VTLHERHEPWRWWDAWSQWAFPCSRLVCEVSCRPQFIMRPGAAPQRATPAPKV
jgi:hypothetical protein